MQPWPGSKAGVAAAVGNRHGCVLVSAVLKCLQARYSLKVFYTRAGCTLVALNPFQPAPHLYSATVMQEYHRAPRPQVQ